MHIIRYNQWLAHTMEDADLAKELASIKSNNEAIRDRFAIDLSFGTAGMRGVIGAGTNRMNIYTVRRATQGLANFVKRSGEDSDISSAKSPPPSVAIGYDSRIKSDLFAREAARVLAANGVVARLYPSLAPVPCLSFAVRSLGCSAGIMITASHNPAKYNGYKVYGPDGCQMTTSDASAVLTEIEKLDIFDDITIAAYEDALQSGWIAPIHNDVLEAYYQNVRRQAVHPGILATAGLNIVYSPLNGAGNIPVRRVLADSGLQGVKVVPQQEAPDGNFPTAPYPNPEEKAALALGLELAEKTGADLMLATDPDADRVGIAVRDKTGAYHLMSGNEVGVLLLDYICKGRKAAGTLPKRPVAVKSIVSTPMADEVARAHGVKCVNVLTGFKYIGEQIVELEKNGEEERFIFGFEESYGYLAGTYVRDKDAVVGSMLICEAAAWYKQQGQTLYEAMATLYDTYGRYLAEVESFSFEGLSGMAKMEEIMAQLRKTPPETIGGLAVLSIADYEKRTIQNQQTGEELPIPLPQSNVLAYNLQGGSIVTVRPSGTEPKVKVYYAVRAGTLPEAKALHIAFAQSMHPMMT